MAINWINVSGGKDSTALLLWTIEEGLPNCRYVYADTKHEHPSVYEYLDYLERETGVTIERIESEGMLELCKRKGMFPSSTVRFCTEELKVFPLARYIEAADPGADHQVWVGVRAEESPSRASLPPFMRSDVKFPPRVTVRRAVHHPLLDWTWREVFSIHERHGIKPNPLYKMGMNRVGCFPCIMAGNNELRLMFQRFPEVVDRLREWERQVDEARSAAGMPHKPAAFFSWSRFPKGAAPGGIDQFAALIDKGEELPGLERDIGGCMSIYGLCE